jgi:DNA-binding transcriptional ArsR family regulator
MRTRNRTVAGVARPLSEVKADLFKALAHPARIRALEVLATGEHSVSDLIPEVGIEASHLSQQLAVLRRAGLVSTRKEGAVVVYALKSPLVKRLLATAKELLLEQLSETRDLLDGLHAEDPAR